MDYPGLSDLLLLQQCLSSEQPAVPETSAEAACIKCAFPDDLPPCCVLISFACCALCCSESFPLPCSAAFLKERLFDQSDAYRVHVCERSGLIAVANLKKQTFYSQIYKSDSSIVQVSWSACARMSDGYSPLL